MTKMEKEIFLQEFEAALQLKRAALAIRKAPISTDDKMSALNELRALANTEMDRVALDAAERTEIMTKAERRELQDRRCTTPLEQNEARAAIAYADAQTRVEVLFPQNTGAVLAKIQQLAKDILLLSTAIDPPHELEGLARLAEPYEVFHQCPRQQDFATSGEWHRKYDEHRMNHLWMIRGYAKRVIATSPKPSGLIVSQGYEHKVFSMINVLHRRIEQLTIETTQNSGLSAIRRAMKERVNDPHAKTGEGKGRKLDNYQRWAWYAGEFLRGGIYLPYKTGSDDFRPWNNSELAHFFEKCFSNIELDEDDPIRNLESNKGVADFFGPMFSTFNKKPRITKTRQNRFRLNCSPDDYMF